MAKCTHIRGRIIREGSFPSYSRGDTVFAAGSDASYTGYSVRRIGSRSFSGAWWQYGLMIRFDRNGNRLANPHGTYCAERVTESEPSGPSAALRISVTDTAGRRLTNVSVTAVEWPAGPAAGSLRWHGDDAPESGETLELAPGTYFMRADGNGTWGGARIVRVSPGQRDSVHFSLGPFPWTPTRASDMVDPRPHLGPPIGTAISDTGAQTPEYTATLDGAAITAGLPLMRRAVLPAGVRQIRLWAGFGNVEPDDMIDLVQRNGEVTGRQLYWFKNPSEYDTLMPGGHDFQFRFAQRIKECGDVRRRDADTTEDGFTHWITCARRLRATPNGRGSGTRSIRSACGPSRQIPRSYSTAASSIPTGSRSWSSCAKAIATAPTCIRIPAVSPRPRAAFANRISRLVLRGDTFLTPAGSRQRAMIQMLANASRHASFFLTMPNPPLTIRLKKTPDAPPVLTGVRADGTATWQHSHVAFPVHDLVHYSVESTLGIGNAFFGLVAQGWSFEDFGNGWPRGPIPAEALEVESIVGEVWRTFLLREELTAAELNERTQAYTRTRRASRARAP